ncbi:MAG: glycosyltransferase family 9 protein [Ignavibacteria bacterium]|nr:glycosyltransferase family 9 protein [Ignavibacteria bacterium]
MNNFNNRLSSLRHNSKWVKHIKTFISAIIYWVGSLLFLFKKKQFNIPRNEIKRILFITLYFRGDVLFHTPAIRLLKLYFTNSGIDVWVKSRSKEILESNPDINQIVVFDGVETDIKTDGIKFSLKEKKDFVNRLRDNKYDLVVDFTGLFSTGLTSFLLRPKYSIGKYEQRFGFFYNKFIDEDLSLGEGHLITKYMELIRVGLDIPADDWQCLLKQVPPKGIIQISDISKNKINDILINREYDLTKPLITIHLTAGWEAKRLDLEKFAELIAQLLESRRFEIAVIGNYYDKTEFSKISSSFETIISKKKINSMFFELPLVLNSAMIERSVVLIGSDSMPLHIAGAVGTSSIGLFGPTNPRFSNPIGINHRLIYNELDCSAKINIQYCTRNAGRTCKSIDCMKMISVQNILNEIDLIMISNNDVN